ncbi:hypothetical protein AG28_20915 [Salmonella enterica subsp. enterica]|nr:SdpI family protein [Salmonella enterica]ECG1136322.1 hypothetical protein [Salmonella enterica subsp. enterica]ECI4631160.1 hypothetical protein [Salmonella enterica subsp. enterica serovar Hartford]
MLISLPLAANKIKPNDLYGIRNKKTLGDDKLWYFSNRVYGLSMIISGAIFFCLSILLGTWRHSAHELVVNLSLFILTTLLPVLITLTMLRFKGEK